MGNGGGFAEGLESHIVSRIAIISIVSIICIVGGGPLGWPQAPMQPHLRLQGPPDLQTCTEIRTRCSVGQLGERGEAELWYKLEEIGSVDPSGIYLELRQSDACLQSDIKHPIKHGKLFFNLLAHALIHSELPCIQLLVIVKLVGDRQYRDRSLGIRSGLDSRDRS